MRPPEPKPEAKKTGEERKDGKANETPAKPPEPTPPPVATTAEPPKRESKTFHARAHLIVTVPLYARWQSLDWEAR